MGNRRKRSGSFLCFGVADREDEADEERRRRGVSRDESRVPKRRLHRMVLRLIFGPWKRSEKKREEKTNRSLSWKEPVSSNEKLSVFSSSSSSSSFSGTAADLSSFSSASSSSCSSSRLSIAAVEVLPAKRRVGMLKSEGSATRILLLVASLSVIVFCGRLCAIMWTSSWLFFVACRHADGEEAAAGKERTDSRLSADLRRRRVEAEEKRRVVLEGLLARNKKV